MQEQTCHVGFVKLFVQEQSVSEPKHVDFDQFELENSVSSQSMSECLVVLRWASRLILLVV